MDAIKEWLSGLWVQEKAIDFGLRAAAFIAVLGFGYLAYLVAKRILLKGVKRVVKHSKTNWDDILLQRKVFNRLCHLVPALLIFTLAPVIFRGFEAAAATIQVAAKVYMILAGLLVADGFLNAVVDICRSYELFRKVPIRGFIQVLKIAIYFFAVIIILSIIIGQSPFIFLGGLGAMTAVLMLVFKDAILGLVAGVQLSMNEMVRIGDWIEMPKYGADGDVIDIALTTVKVQNWDKTISTIPSYALISDSFKNWRGMSESGGRRIKRSVYIDMTSIKFCTEEMLKKFRKFQFITEYIEKKKKELAEYNAAIEVDESELINGRRMTNIGTFRAYVVSYLRNHPRIHQDMTFLVRHLDPTQYGLPVQIYVFSNDQRWANYEAIQADIFDHILAVIPEFELRVFQNPTGADFQRLRAAGG